MPAKDMNEEISYDKRYASAWLCASMMSKEMSKTKSRSRSDRWQLIIFSERGTPKEDHRNRRRRALNDENCAYIWAKRILDETGLLDTPMPRINTGREY